MSARLQQAYPRVVRQADLSPTAVLFTPRLIVLQLLNALNCGAQDAIIISLFDDHPGLAFQALRLINLRFGVEHHPFRSLRQALGQLGRARIKRLLPLLIYVVGEQTEYPSPLLEQASRRGLFMQFQQEYLSRHLDMAQERAYITGVLSLADTRTSMPMAEIVSLLGLSTEMGAALTHRAGRLGRLLELCELLESADESGAQIVARGLCIPFHYVVRYACGGAPGLRLASRIHGRQPGMMVHA